MFDDHSEKVSRSICVLILVQFLFQKFIKIYKYYNNDNLQEMTKLCNNTT